MKPISVALLHVINDRAHSAMNKDLNGGFGTADYFGNSFTSRILMRYKKKLVRLPIFSLAVLQAIFKKNGHSVSYYEGELPSKKHDLYLIYGSIVDISNENNVAKHLKKNFPKSRVGFVGPFPSTRPDLFTSGDFVLIGDPEPFFMHEFKDLGKLSGNIQVTAPTSFDELPTPDYDGFLIDKYSYIPLIKKPFLTLQASKGCPFSCKYYCVYGQYQGPKINQRSPKKVVDDIVALQKKYGVRAIQFRDPVFGLRKEFIPEFCKELKKRKVSVSWGMETRLDILNEDNVRQMYEAGLRNINVGIETYDKEVARLNKRVLIQKQHQEHIISFCNKIGVNISAFYILGYQGDTPNVIRENIKYACSLNTVFVRFAVSTPYPGTDFYTQIEKEGKLLTKDYEKYNQFGLVFKHDNFTPKEMATLLDEAYRTYFFRPSYLAAYAYWRIRNLFS